MNNNGQMYNRRYKVVVIWCFLVAVMIVIQPVLKMDLETMRIFIEKSIWAIGILILGISGTDAAISKFVKKGKETPHDSPK
jgi:hypothetical protein